MKAETNFVFNVPYFENLSKIIVGLFGSLQNYCLNIKYSVPESPEIFYRKQTIIK